MPIFFLTLVSLCDMFQERMQDINWKVAVFIFVQDWREPRSMSTVSSLLKRSDTFRGIYLWM